jgi:hypothetical protein
LSSSAACNIRDNTRVGKGMGAGTGKCMGKRSAHNRSGMASRFGPTHAVLVLRLPGGEACEKTSPSQKT